MSGAAAVALLALAVLIGGILFYRLCRSSHTRPRSSPGRTPPAAPQPPRPEPFRLRGDDLARAGEALLARLGGTTRGDDSLRMAARTLQTIIQASPVAVAVVDEGARVTLWSAAAERIFGWPPEQIQGRPLPLTGAGAEPAETAQLLGRAFGGETISGVELRCRRRDGTLVDLALSAAPLRGPGDRVVGAVALFTDVTERRRLEEQLRHAQRMEAVGRLAGAVAHDFNNLLAAILGFAEVLVAELPEDHPARHDADEIRRVGERGRNLVRQLLAFSRRQPVQAELVNPSQVVAELEPMLRRLIAAEVNLALHLQLDVPQVMIDPSQLEQAVVNLALNARDAMPHGGTLRVETDVAEVRAPGEAGLDLPAGRYVRLVVSDTGVGISEEIRDRIFEPFFTTKERGQGTGLGLSTVYGIVKQARGDIRVSSTPGLGTSFQLYFPAAPDPALA
ncbi:MAG TPA: ATP-binding protein [Gemmatimonadales bacterium]|nr:ATP-binding protein [Gemmatimonadales bacterium]